MGKRSGRQAGDYMQSVRIEKADTAADKEGHDIGWPHYSSDTGNCMCFCKRCFGPSGCICKFCPGVGHENCHPKEKVA